jgi:Big-like domain-containing protein/coenzyme PQQ synthesis protein D (PqqD)
MSERPLSRTEGIVAEELDDGLVIYDDTTKRAHALNASAARLWSLADGRRTVTELAEKAELDEPRTVAALAELAAAGLLVGPPGISRRTVLRRAAVVGAGAVAAAPIIDTVFIPAAAAHASTLQTGGNDGGGGTGTPPGSPVADDDSYTTRAGASLTVAAPGVLANDVSPSGSPLTAILVSGPAHGALSLNSHGSFTYTPVSGFSGTDSFTYRASDGTQTSNTATVTLTVT